MKHVLQRFVEEGRAVLFINLAVVVLLAYVLSLWINLAVSARMADIPKYAPPKITKKTQSYRKADYSIIKRHNIFNPSAAPETTSRPSSPNESIKAAATALNLKLLGTIITDSGTHNLAVIEDKKTKQQKLYSVNENAAPGAKIVRIDRFTVLIDNAGRMESLTMEYEKGFPKGRKGRKGRGKSARSASLGGGPDVQKVGAGEIIMDKRYLDKQLGDMNSLMTQVRVVPNKSKDGNVEGFKLFQIKKGSIYEKIGLKNRDVIERINGQPLNSVESGLDLFQALKSETHFTVDLKRRDSKQTLTVNVQ
ncbi:MAG: hypothetical protein IEMM0002_0226 [bacterium]|nr:MAG: hypothetical protein IEMM0002_0226 [bacterium]